MTTEMYREMRAKLADQAEAFTNEICGEEPGIKIDKKYWSDNWNECFHKQMDHLVAEHVLPYFIHIPWKRMPGWANYVGINGNGSWHYFSLRPVFNEEMNGWLPCEGDELHGPVPADMLPTCDNPRFSICERE